MIRHQPCPDLETALAAYRDGRFAEAERTCQKLLATSPPANDALHLLGLVEMAQGRLTAAVETLIAVTIRLPFEAAVHNNLGIALRKLCRFPPAIAAFKNAVECRPVYPEALYNLATTLNDAGEYDEAIDALHRCLSQEPGHSAARFSLGELLAQIGDDDEAANHLSRYLKEDPGDLHGAEMLLAQMNRIALPSHASFPHLNQLYSAKASTWDSQSGYLAHRHVAHALMKHLPGKNRRILDIGCGTGLVGSLLCDRVEHLVGVDISEAMLSVAQEKQIYDALFHSDMMSFLLATPHRFDAISAAAVFIHFGDLAPILAGAVHVLHAGGQLSFTTYPNDAMSPNHFGVCLDANLARAGCFAHGSSYIRQAAEIAGFSVLELTEVIHEFGTDQVQTGLLVVLERK